MRSALHALTDELRRLKTTGVKTVVVAGGTAAIESLWVSVARRLATAHDGLRIRAEA